MADEIVIGKIGLTPKGEYVPGELYDILDMVSHEGNSYVSKIQNNEADVTNTEAWLLAATKGGKGDKGDTFTFSDLTTEQKEELKGDVIAYNSLDEADKNDLASRVPVIGAVEEGNENAVSGGEVFEKLQKNKIGQWTAQPYTAGQQVLENDVWYEAVVNTTAAQRPGVVAETIWQPIMEAIAPESVFDYIDSTNLIIKDDLLPNKTYNTTNGTLLTVSGRLTTPKIPALPNTAYTLTGGRPQYYGVFFWKANGDFISGSLSGSVGVVQPYTFTTPPDTAFTAVTPTDRDYALYIDTVQLNLGSEVLPYEPGYVNKPIIKPALIPSGGGGQAYDQSLNTFDSVSFANLEVEGLLLDLPTSPTGLSTGQAWIDTSNGNTLKIV